MDEQKMGVCQKKSRGQSPHTREDRYGILIYAADCVRDRWQRQYTFPSDSNLFAPDHGLHQWSSAEGYAPHVDRLWNHAGTSVGNGMGRTPQRKECRTCLGAKGNRHGLVRLLLPSMVSWRKIGVIFIGHQRSSSWCQ